MLTCPSGGRRIRLTLHVCTRYLRNYTRMARETTVESLITDPPRSGQPPRCGQAPRNGLKLPYIRNLREADASEIRTSSTESSAGPTHFYGAPFVSKTLIDLCVQTDRSQQSIDRSQQSIDRSQQSIDRRRISSQSISAIDRSELTHAQMCWSLWRCVLRDGQRQQGGTKPFV